MGLPGPAGPVGPPGEDGDKVRRAEKAPPRTTLGPAGQRPWVRAGAVTVDKGVQALWGLRGQSHPAHPVLSVPVADLGTAHSRVVVNEAAFIDVIYRPLSSQELRSRCPPVWRPRRPRRPLLAVEQSRAPCRPHPRGF